MVAVAVLPACGNAAMDAVRLVPGGLSQGLIAHWTFDDDGGSSVRDSSSNHHDGTVNGSTWSWLGQGRFGGALHLEQGDYVSVESFPNATSGWTVSAWLFIASKDVGTDDVTVISTEDVYKGGWEMNLAAAPAPLHQHFAFWKGPGGPDYAHAECLGCLRADEWQHFAGVVDGATRTLSIYLDGVLQDRILDLPPISPGVPTLYMGRWATTDPARLLVGSLDDIAIWNRALVGVEIASLTQAPAP
jgi:hypothetical protein